jgi:hypothetical protein
MLTRCLLPVKLSLERKGIGKPIISHMIFVWHLTRHRSVGPLGALLFGPWRVGKYKHGGYDSTHKVMVYLFDPGQVIT